MNAHVPVESHDLKAHLAEIVALWKVEGHNTEINQCLNFIYHTCSLTADS